MLNKNKTLEIESKNENLNLVQNYVSNFMKENGFNENDKMKVDVIVEEVFINICSYAYNGSTGPCVIELKYDENKIIITFKDNGIQYDPLKRKDPDITLAAEDRPIGGLGIYMTKKMMNEVSYKYENNTNILTIIKNKT